MPFYVCFVLFFCIIFLHCLNVSISDSKDEPSPPTLSTLLSVLVEIV